MSRGPIFRRPNFGGLREKGGCHSGQFFTGRAGGSPQDWGPGFVGPWMGGPRRGGARRGLWLTLANPILAYPFLASPFGRPILVNPFWAKIGSSGAMFFFGQFLLRPILLRPSLLRPSLLRPGAT